MKTNAYRTGSRPKQVRDLLAREIVYVVHQHDVALSCRKERNRRPYKLEKFAVSIGYAHHVTTGKRKHAPLHYAAPQAHLREIDGNPAEPRRESIGVAQLRAAEVSAQKRFLHDLFRVVDRQHPLYERLYPMAMSRHKRCERIRVSGKRRLYELALASHA
jgi:hypothetical protein